MDPRNILRVIEDAAKAAGVEGVGVHTLRHSAAVGWLEAGRSYQGGSGHARPFVHFDYRRHLRSHVG